jgi:hypothetical protein
MSAVATGRSMASITASVFTISWSRVPGPCRIAVVKHGGELALCSKVRLASGEAVMVLRAIAFCYFCGQHRRKEMMSNRKIIVSKYWVSEMH